MSGTSLLRHSIPAHQFLFTLAVLFASVFVSRGISPPSASQDATVGSSSSSRSLLSSEERDSVYNNAYDQAVVESDILVEEEDEDGVVLPTAATAPNSVADEEADEADCLLEGVDLSSLRLTDAEDLPQSNPSSQTVSETPVSTEFPILTDPRLAVEAAIREQVPGEDGRELIAALSRIRQREGWPTAIELERFVVRIEAWQEVLRAELEQGGSLPEFSRWFTQPAERYVAPVLSQYAWPPLYALKRAGEYVDESKFGEGGTLSERIVARMGECESPSIIGNLDVSYLAFPGSCTGKHPLTRYLYESQRNALNRFHFRIYRELLRYPRTFVANGGDVNTDLVLPLLDEGIFEQETVTLRPRLANIGARFDLHFIRPPGTSRRASSLLIVRRHPQALSERSTPTLPMQLRADVASELIRGLAYRGHELPPHHAFLKTFSRSTSSFVTPGDTDEPFEPSRVPLEFRISHLARVERGRSQPFTLEGLQIVDFAVAQAVREVLRRLPEPRTEPVPCPPHIAGSPLQQTHHRLIARATETLCRTQAVRRKGRWKVTMTSEEEKLLADFHRKKAERQKEALKHPGRVARWKKVNRDAKRNRTDAERARALDQDRKSYRVRRANMPPEEREGRLEAQSLRSNVRDMTVVSPFDLFAALAAGHPQGDSATLDAGPIASGSNALLPVVGSSKNPVLPLPIHLPNNNSTSFQPYRPPPLPRLPNLKKRSKDSQAKPLTKKPHLVLKVTKNEDQEDEKDGDPEPIGKGKGVKRRKDDDPSMRKKGW